jgi:hypothetical protein
MTTKEDWIFRAHTLREAANHLRNSAMQLLEDARRYEGLAEGADRMATRSPQENASE